MKAQGKSAGLGSPPSPAPSSVSVTRLLLNVSLARIVLSLSGILNPVQNLVSGQLLLGVSVWQVTRDLLRRALYVLGYLSAPVQLAWLQSLSRYSLVNVRRWHVAAGETMGEGPRGPGRAPDTLPPPCVWGGGPWREGPAQPSPRPAWQTERTASAAPRSVQYSKTPIVGVLLY